MSQMQIIRATPQDIDRTMTIIRSCIEQMNAQDINQWDEVYPDQATLERDITTETLYLAVDRDCAMGFIVLNEVQAEEYKSINWRYRDGKILIVHRLSVDAAWQGQGIASWLMDFAENHGRRQGYSAIRLDAFTQNPGAVRLYIKRDYRQAGMVDFRKGRFFCFEKHLDSPSS